MPFSMNSDFHILHSHLIRHIDYIGSLNCADSIHGLQILDKKFGLKRDKYNLESVYKSLYSNNTSTMRLHTAENDVKMLLDIIIKYPGELLSWLVNTSTSFMHTDHRKYHGLMVNKHNMKYA